MITSECKTKFSFGMIALLISVSLVLWVILYRNLAMISEMLVFDLFAVSRTSHFGSSLQFFVYEVPKVLLLLTVVIFAVGIIRTFFTPLNTRKLLAGRGEVSGNFLAALLGTVTPFCSCSAIPLFIGFLGSGVRLGVTFSFLIAAPMVNEIAAVMLLGLFGWKVTLLYIASGLSIAIIAGWLIGRFAMEKYVEEWVYTCYTTATDGEPLTPIDRVKAGVDAVKEILTKVWIYIVLGIAVGAGIHGFVPTGVMASFMGKDEWWTVPAAVLLGIPMYSNAAGIIPIVHALLEKGAALGTSLAFMMAVIALSLPEVIILRKVLRPQLIAVFLSVVTFGIVTTGYLFKFLL